MTEDAGRFRYIEGERIEEAYWLDDRIVLRLQHQSIAIKIVNGKIAIVDENAGPTRS